MNKDWQPITALECSISQRTLRRWCEAGQIKARKRKNVWFVHFPSMRAEYEKIIAEEEAQETSNWLR